MKLTSTKHNRYFTNSVNSLDWTAISVGQHHSLGILAEEAKTSSNFFLFFN